MTRRDIIIGLLIALFLAIFISPFASSFPDGLEKVAGDKNFIEMKKKELPLKAPIPDYLWPNIKDEKIATSAAGAGGTILIFLATIGIGYMIKKKMS